MKVQVHLLRHYSMIMMFYDVMQYGMKSCLWPVPCSRKYLFSMLVIYLHVGKYLILSYPLEISVL